MRKVASLLLLISAVMLLLVPGACTTSSKKSDAVKTNTTTPPVTETVVSVCSITADMVGQKVKVAGTLGTVNSNDSDGVFVDLIEGSCRIGVFVNSERWNSWADDEKDLVATGNEVIAEGELRSFEGTLLIDAEKPLVPWVGETVTTAAGTETSISDMLAGLGIVDEPLAEKRLDVGLIFSGTDEPALCYLGSYSMLAAYADNTIDLPEVIASSGYGVNGYYIEPANMLVDGLFLWSIGQSAQHLGFDYYVSAQKGGAITNDFISEKLAGGAEQILWMNDGDASFDLLKRLISSGIPAEVYLDCVLIREDLTARPSYWDIIYNYLDNYTDSAHTSHYFAVTGYDAEYVYVNDPTEPNEDIAKDIPIDIGNFMEAWKNGNHLSFAEEERVGPYWMLFLGERGEAVSAEYLIEWNRELAENTAAEIRKAAAVPNINNVIHGGSFCRSRQEFGLYLKRHGYTEAGDIFLRMSELFEGLILSDDQSGDLLLIAGLHEESLDLW